MAFVYALIDPRTDEVRYIGQTKFQQKRYKQHIQNFNDGNVDKKIWIDELKAMGLLPTYKVLEDNVEWESRFEREKYWIDYHVAQGSSLTNL